MEQKQLPKSLFATIASLSLAAFLFVNIHAALTLPSQLQPTGLESRISAQESKDSGTPGFTVATHLFNVVKRLMPYGK